MQQKEEQKGGQNIFAIAVDALKSIKDIILAFYKLPDVPTSAKIFVTVFVIAAIVLLVIAFVAGVKENTPVSIFTLVCFFLLSFSILFYMNRAIPNQPQRSEVKPVWSRLVPRMPMREPIISHIQSILEKLQKEVFVNLKDKYQELEKSYIRCNIFLPDTKDSSPNCVCELFIPKKCHVGMRPPDDNLNSALTKQYQEEREVRFKPEEGATGLVFSTQRFEIAKIVDKDDSNCQWSLKYNLTESHKKAINKELKWVVSVPVKFIDAANQEQTVGVLNVDGLKIQMKDSDIKTIVLGKAIGAAGLLAGELKSEPIAKISIVIEEL